MLQPSSNNEDLKKHKFMVQSILSPDPEQLSSQSVDEIFKSTSSSEILSKKLFCSFIEQKEDDVPQESYQLDANETSARTEEPEQCEEYESNEPIEHEVAKNEEAPVLDYTNQEYNTIESTVEKSEEPIAKPIARPVIESVPQEPKIINPIVEKPVAAAKPVSPIPAPKVAHSNTAAIKKPNHPQVQSRSVSDAENKKNLKKIRELEESNKQLLSQLRTRESPSNKAISQENPATIKKVMLL